MTAKEPKTVFDDAVKAEYLRLIQAGYLRFDAAKRLGVTNTDVKRHFKADPEFQEALIEAELEATEPVENVLYKAALLGEPWAVKEWLTKRDKQRWADPDKTVNHNISGTLTHVEEASGTLAAVQLLLADLADRHATRTEAVHAALPPGPKAPPIQAVSRPAPAPIRPVYNPDENASSEEQADWLREGAPPPPAVPHPAVARHRETLDAARSEGILPPRPQAPAPSLASSPER